MSRTHPELVKRLFESEVTEVKDGIVEIKSIAREAGSRSKIAVSVSYTHLYLADGQEIVLSKTEQKLLKLFTEHIGQTLTREQLIDTLWTGDRKYVDENALSVTVNRLRRKLEGKEMCIRDRH